MTPTTAIATIIPILFTIVSVVLWIIYGKDLKYKISKSSNLPKNMNSLELGLIDKGYSDEKDAFCLLLELSNKGYIKIIEKDNFYYFLKFALNFFLSIELSIFFLNLILSGVTSTNSSLFI